jgi:hypothetical protein
MRRDQNYVLYSSLSRLLGYVFPLLGLPQLSFSVPSRLHLDLDVRQAERTDNVKREYAQVETGVLYMWSTRMMADEVCRPKGPCQHEMVALGQSALSRPSSMDKV